MNFPPKKTVTVFLLVAITFFPYLATYLKLTLPVLYIVELMALFVWYLASLSIPLLIKEVSTSLLFWIYHLVLMGIPVGSDVVYRITGITPSLWWNNLKNVMPVAWFGQGMLSRHYFSFISTLGLLLLPGCVFFILFWIKTSKKSQKEGFKTKAL